ncbi:hypothetical protein ES332_A05G378700v1 [Gossypium tomentosum]|uniref:Uncharacterized protein n=1 Tax=Gossypium tomentosum TaxID=34277 RepID=A0A5D2QPI6_GOSTO|nr:hypothetical protein ES332_A05G378700v1 [Gossypium tomentosum]
MVVCLKTLLLKLSQKYLLILLYLICRLPTFPFFVLSLLPLYVLSPLSISFSSSLIFFFILLFLLSLFVKVTLFWSVLLFDEDLFRSFVVEFLSRALCWQIKFRSSSIFGV